LRSCSIGKGRGRTKSTPETNTAHTRQVSCNVLDLPVLLEDVPEPRLGAHALAREDPPAEEGGVLAAAAAAAAAGEKRRAAPSAPRRPPRRRRRCAAGGRGGGGAGRRRPRGSREGGRNGGHYGGWLAAMLPGRKGSINKSANKEDDADEGRPPSGEVTSPFAGGGVIFC
jgi:hypothetical protein